MSSFRIDFPNRKLASVSPSISRLSSEFVSVHGTDMGDNCKIELNFASSETPVDLHAFIEKGVGKGVPFEISSLS